MEITFLSSSEDILLVLKKSNFSKFNINLNTFVNNKLFTSVILIEPYLINNIYFAISPIWEHYLAIHSPNTKLIVMGFCNYQSRNYIDLLNLPKDFNAYVENALPVSEDWEIPIDGADMLEYLKRFFAGHGGNSLLSKLNQLKQSVNIAYTQIVNKESTFEEIWQELLLPYAKPEWQELLNRWENYYPYFEYLPFYPTIQEISKIFSEISEFFACINPQEKLFLNKGFDSQLTSIYQKLSEIDRLYIRPEIYREEPVANY